MKTEELVPSLKLNVLTQEQYDNAVLSGQISSSELYFTPDIQKASDITMNLPPEFQAATASDLQSVLTYVLGEIQKFQNIQNGNVIKY